ncbi:DUF1802 family protein [Alkalinema pantanalense CENA528]|uniref:DUF1802 family protein n=1 Tax=Alkalinema pantanalense TaxID=1620705 RepID=UPI003D6F436C
MKTEQTFTMLCLPAPDVKGLATGRLIFSFPSIFIRTGQSFLLCPSEVLGSSDSVEYCYKPNFHQSARDSLSALDLDCPEIEYWAKCEKCSIFNNIDQIEALSALSIWTRDWLTSKLDKQQSLFLAILRLYKLTSPFTLPPETIYQDRVGKYVSLPTSYQIEINQPILEDRIFEKRKKQLEELRTPENLELETLHSQISEILTINPAAKLLEKDLTDFLGWAQSQTSTVDDSEFHWIDQIATVGNSSDGNTFEKMVRKSLIQLGFSNSLNNPKASLDPDASGGAGGIDVYCDAPFSLVGECKATKHETVSNGVSAQLIHLGHTHLGKAIFDRSVKVIFAAGELTNPAQQAAVQNQMNVMRPETLQRLVTLKSQYPGSIDLQQLRVCLETQPFGQDSDNKVNQFIDGIYQNLQIRSHIIQVIRKHLDIVIQMNTKDVDSTVIYGLYLGSNPPTLLTPEQLKEILVELASPLAGYLGRVPGTDRFYFLRELSIA